MNKFFPFIFFITVIIGCKKNEANKNTSDNSVKYVLDTHSYAKPNQAVAKHLDLNIDVDFDKKNISGTATYQIETNKKTKEIHFDSQNLTIQKVTVNDLETKFELKKGDKVHGDDLIIPVNNKTKKVSITYKTNGNNNALQWLNKQQTADKKNPFLFTQGQAILTRSWIPIQDSPQIRITYNATVKVPKQLMAVMSAQNPKQKSNTGVYNFKMPQAISPYLIALAVGDLIYKPISERTGIYAEKSLVNKAQKEFEDVEKMMTAAENLYGKYPWEQYDLLVLPPSFPFGGMENPRLTFVTPTVIAGDKSLTTLIAHELAHSWSGNLVTNATWDDFWLNEGFTVYFERRIMEAVYGQDYANMLAVIGRQDLDETLEMYKNKPESTKLKLDLKDKNPDDGMTDIPYEKGFLLLKTIENKVGKEKMDLFLKEYFNKHKFSTITTEKFISYLNKNLLESNNINFNVSEWIYKSGIPKNSIAISSNKFDEVMQTISKWKAEKISSKEICNKNWVIQQRIHFIRNIPKEISNKKLKELDDDCGFSNTSNSYIAMVWFEQAAKRNYHANNIDKKMEEFLINVGRRWYVTTIYNALKENDRVKEAVKIYKKAKPNYHSVTTRTVDKMLEIKSE
jgi:aminopeptidase N